MTTTNEIKEQLGKTTEQLEQYLEPWQRGTLIIVLTTLLLISAYLLLRKEKSLPEDEKKQIEKLTEEKLLKQMAFYKRLRE